MPRNNDLPGGMTKAQATGQGLLKKSYGPDDDTVDEQLNALQQRGFKLAAKVKAMNPNPNQSGLQTMAPPQQASKVPMAAMQLKGKR